MTVEGKHGNAGEFFVGRDAERSVAERVGLQVAHCPLSVLYRDDVFDPDAKVAFAGGKVGVAVGCEDDVVDGKAAANIERVADTPPLAVIGRNGNTEGRVECDDTTVGHVGKTDIGCTKTWAVKEGVHALPRPTVID